MQTYTRFDVEALARDMELGGEIHTRPDEAGVHIFSTL
jgi:hypothetical protein